MTAPRPPARPPAQAVFKDGRLQCSTCGAGLKPGHHKRSCCKAAYRRHKKILACSLR
jgi:hypothetical protein